MNGELTERVVDCPFCGEPIELLLDLSAGSQTYIEDCQVCCQPMQVRLEVSGDTLDRVSVSRDD